MSSDLSRQIKCHLLLLRPQDCDFFKYSQLSLEKFIFVFFTVVTQSHMTRLANFAEGVEQATARSSVHTNNVPGSQQSFFSLCTRTPRFRCSNLFSCGYTWARLHSLSCLVLLKNGYQSWKSTIMLFAATNCMETKSKIISHLIWYYQ